MNKIIKYLKILVQFSEINLYFYPPLSNLHIVHKLLNQLISYYRLNIHKISGCTIVHFQPLRQSRPSLIYPISISISKSKFYNSFIPKIKDFENPSLRYLRQFHFVCLVRPVSLQCNPKKSAHTRRGNNKYITNSL